MNELERSQRAAVVAEASTWLRTPYCDSADIKHAGVDCGMFLVRAFVDTGLVEPFDPRPYSRTWFLHRNEEKYLEIIYRCGGREIAGPPLPGDVVVYKVGRLYAHGGIVSVWPKVIHAFQKAGMVVESDVSLQGIFNDPKYPRRFFSYWARSAAT